MISIAQIFPEHLDLNGDGANVLVLQRRLEWAGVPVKVVRVEPGQFLTERPDLVVIGHGSSAAWKQIYGSFARLVPSFSEWMNQGTIVIAISSGFAALHGLLPDLTATVSRKERTSKFVSETFEDQTLIGYLNTDLDLPNLLIRENLIGSMLHGPVLAKNSWLCDWIFGRIGVSAGMADATKFEKVASLEMAARALATEQSEN